MKRVLYALLTILTAIVLIVTQAQAGLTQEMVNVARQVTVRVSSSEPGSGVIIGRDNSIYYVLTAYHVIDIDQTNPENMSIVAPDQSQYPVQAIRYLPGASMDLDLAIVEFSSSRNYTTVRVGDSDSLDINNPVWVSGFPTPGGLTTAQRLEVADGIIRSVLPAPTPEGYQLIYSNITADGMSGGAVLDQTGALVGIHGKAEASGRGFAIPINIFTRVASQMGISVSRSSNSASPPSSNSGNLESNCRQLRADYNYWEDRERSLSSACFFDESEASCREQEAAAESSRQAERQWAQIGCPGQIWGLF